MRIAFIASNRSSANGGSEELWAKAAIYALNQRHEVICSVYNWETKHYLHEELKSKGAKILYRPRRSVDQGVLNRAFLKFRDITRSKLIGPHHEFRKLLKLKPDLICLSQGSSYDHAYHRDYEYLFEKYDRDYYILMHSYQSNIILRQERKLRSQKILTKAKTVFYVAEKQLEAIEQQLNIKLDNSKLVFNPLNINSFKCLPFLKSECLKMVMIGNLTIRWKGHDLLLDALNSVFWKSDNWQLDIYGNGEDEELIKNTIKTYSLENKIRLRGVDRNIEKVLLGAHILLMPSRVEAAPLTVQEAMLCGRPVLTTDVGDMKSYYENGVSGFLAESTSVNSIRSALNSMWKNRNGLDEMGRIAFQQAKAKFPEHPEKDFLKEMINAE